MIKAIIFDAGGVIVESGPILGKFIEIFHPKDREKFWHDVNIKAVAMCRGEMTEEDYWKEIAISQEMDPESVPLDMWTKYYEEFTSINQEVIQLIKNLKKQYKVALISNTIPPHAKVNKKRGFYDLFDVLILSHEVKMSKNNKKIFLLAIEKLNLKAEECIFIDDVQEFVDIAKSIGMKAILYQTPPQIKKELKKFGILN